jgi:hypothetical protein
MSVAASADKPVVLGYDRNGGIFLAWHAIFGG